MIRIPSNAAGSLNECHGSGWHRSISLAVLGLVLTLWSVAAETVASIPGIPTFTTTNLVDFVLEGQDSKAAYTFVNVTGQRFDQAIRVRVTGRTPHAYDVQILTPPTTRPAKKGEQFLATFTVRCPEASNGFGVFGARIQAGAPDWSGFGATDVVVGKEWKPVVILGTAPADCAAGQYDLALHLGTQAQTLELGGFALLNLGTTVDVRRLPFTRLTYPGREPDAPWRKTAAERIDKYRKADLTVHVVDRNGRPVTGVPVHVQMQRHAYGFGTFLECWMMTGTGPDTDKLRDWTLKLFNRCTTPIYWADWGWVNPEARQRFLKCAQWAHDHQLATRGHCIIYPGWKFLPAAVRSLTNDPPALRKQLLAHVVEVTDATRPFNFTEYDVCNELRNLTEIHGLLGRDAVAEWFKVARAHAPNSRMAINEDRILACGGATLAEEDNYAGWIQYLIDQGEGPDVIGLQGHFDEAVTGPVTVLRILDRFAKFGKAIQVTEFDINTRDEKGQADYTRDFLTAVFSHPATDAFTMWGFWEGKMWQPLGAMLRKDWTLKPNGQAFMDLVHKEWWTDVTGSTGRDGVCTTRGFLGDYRISVTVGGKETTRQVKLAKSGTTTVLALD